MSPVFNVMFSFNPTIDLLSHYFVFRTNLIVSVRFQSNKCDVLKGFQHIGFFFPWSIYFEGLNIDMRCHAYLLIILILLNFLSPLNELATLLERWDKEIDFVSPPHINIYREITCRSQPKVPSGIISLVVFRDQNDIRSPVSSFPCLETCWFEKPARRSFRTWNVEEVKFINTENLLVKLVFSNCMHDCWPNYSW